MDFELTYINKNKKRCIRRNFTDGEFSNIKEVTPWVKDQSRKSIRERVYCILNDIKETPKCPVCGVENHFLRSGRYSVACSPSCGIKNQDTQKNTLNTHLKRYGKRFTNPEKAKSTCLERYGVEHTSMIGENRQSAVETWKDRYTKEQHYELIRAGFMKKYGVDNIWKDKTIIDEISIKKTKHFQLRRNDEGTDYSGTVYILWFFDYNAIKIGLTSDFEGRSKALRRDFGDFKVIKLIETDECFSLEMHFHEQLDEFRICLTEGAGRTEFFSQECLQRLGELISEDLQNL